MKYNITINQRAVADMNLLDQLDLIDLAIYDFIISFMLSSESKKLVIGTEQYSWIKADTIIENLPILGIKSTRGINKRIDNLVEAELLERCPNNQSLQQSFFKVGKRYSEYIFSERDNCDELGTKVHHLEQKFQGAWNNCSDNNNIKDKKGGDTNVSYEGEPSLGKEEVIEWDAFLKFFNDTMANKAINPISLISKKRKGNIRARMREYGKKALFDVIKKAAASDFLNGKNNRGWMADFDWLFRPNNFPKVLEGNYDNKEGVQYFNNQNNNYGRETITDKINRTIEEANEFSRKLRENIGKETEMGFGDSEDIW